MESYKNPQRVVLVEDDFEPIGFDKEGCACDDPRDNHDQLRLLATLSINGTLFHVEAVAVYRGTDGIQRAECLSWKERLESFSVTFEPDGGWMTVELFGRSYVLLMEPYSD